MTSIGVLGGQWRATVTACGGIQHWGGLDDLEWFVAADDRWHVPARESTVRQTRLGGAPVVETRVRIPGGDAVQRVYAVADHGGATVVEIDNESPLPIAIAFTGPAVVAARPAVAVPIEGIGLPASARVFPVGHHATLRVVVAHAGSADAWASWLPSLPAGAQVAAGWASVCARASRLELPDESSLASVLHSRAELLLRGPPDVDDDPIGFLLGIAQLVRLGERAVDWVPDAAQAVRRVSRDDPSWELDAALDAAGVVFADRRETRALRDLARVRVAFDSRVGQVALVPPAAGDVSGVRVVSVVERRLATRSMLLPAGIPAAWLGQHFEAHGIPTGPSSTVSFAVRWHGARPAVLWEAQGLPVKLSAPSLAPGWTSTEHSGEALWPAPDALSSPPLDSPLDPPSISFT